MKLEYIPVIVNSTLAIGLALNGEGWKAFYWLSATGIAVALLHLKG